MKKGIFTGFLVILFIGLFSFTAEAQNSACEGYVEYISPDPSCGYYLCDDRLIGAHCSRGMVAVHRRTGCSAYTQRAISDGGVTYFTFDGPTGPQPDGEYITYYLVEPGFHVLDFTYTPSFCCPTPPPVVETYDVTISLPKSDEDCDDDDCLTDDIYDVAACMCRHLSLEQPSCDDDDCTTEDFYDASTCQCEHTTQNVVCNNFDCFTVNNFNPLTCQCELDTIEVAATYYRDVDEDGFGNPNDTFVSFPCQNPFLHGTDDNTDCDDTNPEVHTGCGGGLDTDDDGDGFTENEGDCDDVPAPLGCGAGCFPGAGPGNEEICDEYDNDCNDAVNDMPVITSTNPQARAYPCDHNGSCSNDDDGDGISEEGGDCDDCNPLVHPGSTHPPGTLQIFHSDANAMCNDGTFEFNTDLLFFDCSKPQLLTSGTGFFAIREDGFALPLSSLKPLDLDEGEYQYTDVPPGHYTVRVVSTTGMVATGDVTIVELPCKGKIVPVMEDFPSYPTVASCPNGVLNVKLELNGDCAGLIDPVTIEVTRSGLDGSPTIWNATDFIEGMELLGMDFPDLTGGHYSILMRYGTCIITKEIDIAQSCDLAVTLSATNYEYRCGGAVQWNISGSNVGVDCMSRFMVRVEKSDGNARLLPDQPAAGSIGGLDPGQYIVKVFDLEAVCMATSNAVGINPCPKPTVHPINVVTDEAFISWDRLDCTQGYQLVYTLVANANAQVPNNPGRGGGNSSANLNCNPAFSGFVDIPVNTTTSFSTGPSLCPGRTYSGLIRSKCAPGSGDIDGYSEATEFTFTTCRPNQQCSSAKKDGEEGIISSEAEIFNEALLNAYPNPFSDQLNIEFTLPRDSRAKLEIFNIGGQKLAEVFEGNVKAHETQKIEYSPNASCNCVVIYRLQTEQETYHGKAIMAK